MTSKIKVDNINKVSDDSNIIKKCGTTTTIGSGASNPIVVDGSAITLGRCGGTVALASGATQTGFGRTGTVNWVTTPKTSTFTAANGEGYFINSGSAITINLPAGSAGAIVAVSDYARNFSTYNLTISPNGSEKIGGIAQDATLNVSGQAATFVYVDATKGWVNVQNAEDTETGIPLFITATGGTITESGNFRIHKFTGPGTFNITNLAPGPSGNPNSMDYLVVGGGGAGGPCVGGGGGAGGTRFSNGTATGCYTAGPSPLGASALTATITSFPITVGAGTTGSPCGTTAVTLARGSSSIFSTITSTGGGSGGGGSGTSSPICSVANGSIGGPGGSGGGGGFRNGNPGGSGDTPPTSPAQGTSGGASTPSASPTTIDAGGGGGGAVSGSSNGSDNTAGPGGTGITNSITASPVGYGGGGGGGACSSGGTAGTATQGGGAGGKGTGTPDAPGTAGTANTGGGGGGSIGTAPSGNGGSGVVIIRYKFQ